MLGLRWLGAATFDLQNPPRRELAAIYHAEVSADLTLVVSDELTDLRWISLPAHPAGTTPLDLAVAPWAIHGDDVHG